MNKKSLLTSILSALGLKGKAEDKSLTPDDIAQIESSVREKTGAGLNELLAQIASEDEEADNTSQSHQETLNTIAGIIGNVMPQSNEGGSPSSENNQQIDASTVIESVTRMATSFEEIANRAAQPKPVATAAPIIGLNGPGTTSSHFLGISNDLFARTHRWNEIAANGGYGVLNQTPSNDEVKAFNKAFGSYGASLAARFEELRLSNRLDPKILSEFTNDFSGLDTAKLGDQYITRRQDALIARLITFYNIYDIFPRRFNVQDRDVMFTAFFKQVSQAWQKGRVFKGGMQLQPEVGHVDDAMIKIHFEPMKEIERMYIGYLNTEGSDPMKWSMIEWQLLNIMQVAINEQNHRRIMGIYVKPEDNTPGHYLHASTGVFYTLFRYSRENKMKLHDSAEFRGYAEDTMLETVQDLIEKIRLDTSKDHTVRLEDFIVILNANHRSWWKRNCRAVYGKDLDFTGPESMLNKVPDTDITIKWLPNLGQLPWIIIEEPGNIQLPENIAGEMLAMQFDREMESYIGWSVWKEGCAASFVGVQFRSKEEMDNNNFHMQRIFMNTPLLTMEADTTTVDAKKGLWFRSVANAAETKLTDIANAELGIAYIIEIGDETNPTAIDKAGKFDQITENFAPTKVGDYIMVVLNNEGDKFLELERCVAGVRTPNYKLQPNIPGAR